MTRYSIISLTAGAVLVTGGCTDALDAITSHSRPVAAVGSEQLAARELGAIMADSPLPDSALTGHWAAQIGRLWADYVSIVKVFEAPDSTESLDFDPLLRAGRYYPALEVQRYRDSVVLAGLEPTDEEVRAHFEETQPLTRLDIRRIRWEIPEGATDARLDSLLARARSIRQRVAGGTDFVEAAREFSEEPASARGQLLTYQGHVDFHPRADSVVFRLRPGEISPVVQLPDELVIYRVERRRTPEFENVIEIVRRDMYDRRRGNRLANVADSLLENSLRSVTDGAVRAARLVATTTNMAVDRIAGPLRLVIYEGGEFTVAELRELFQARPDLKQRFAQSDDEQIALDLYELAGDEVLIAAASRSGVGLPAGAEEELRDGIASQLSQLARQMDISHRLVSDPAYDLRAESRRFLRSVLDQAAPVAWLTEFRGVLDQRYPSRVDERSAELAAAHARDLRAMAASADSHEEGADRGAGTEPEPAEEQH